MSGESFVAVGGLAAIVLAAPVVIAAAGVLVVGGAAVAGVGAAAGAIGEQAQRVAQEHRAKLIEEHAAHQTVIEALDEAISELEDTRASLANALGARFMRSAHGGASAEDFGSFVIDAEDSKTWQQLLEDARIASKVVSKEAGDAIDLTDQFSEALALQEEMRIGREGYIEQTRARLMHLIPLGVSERAQVERMWERVNELEKSSLSVAMIKENVGAPLDDLCARLGEAMSDQRRFLYSNYLGLCALLHERPRDLSYEAMERAVMLLSEQHLKNVMDRRLPTMRDALDEALGREGFEAICSATVDEVPGVLYADAGNDACGLLVAPTPDGGFYFATVGADDPEALDEAASKRLQAIAEGFCKKKEAALEYLAKAYGFDAQVIAETPVEVASIPYCAAFAEHLRAQFAMGDTGDSTDRKREYARWQNSAVAGKVR